MSGDASPSPAGLGERPAGAGCGGGGDARREDTGTLRGRLIRIGSDYCDEGNRAEVEAFFRPRAEKAYGGERVLDATLEQIDLCIAARKAQLESVEAFLRKY